ncbi:hypothetical protein [Microbulbifer variabilis]|uniref:hypothetical protein n=1 Tax=Microbulbifer variabilis TaxID=266805 RepID=UPI00036AB2F1|nr:hypothetical protein [Microbulbifer variabilis]
MKEQVAGSAGVTGAGIGLTQTPVDWLQVVGILIAGLGLIWNIYAVITRNQHNRYMREKRDKSDGNTPLTFFATRCSLPHTTGTGWPLIWNNGMKWKALVKTIAPTIGMALGGPAAGVAVKFMAEKLLGDGLAGEQEIADFVLGSSPEQLAELRALDNKFRLQMRQLDIDVFELEVRDRDSARGLASKTSLLPQVALSVLFIGGYFALLFFLFGGEVALDGTHRDIAVCLLGVMKGEIPRIMSFWFGSS